MLTVKLDFNRLQRISGSTVVMQNHRCQSWEVGGVVTALDFGMGVVGASEEGREILFFMKTHSKVVTFPY